MCTKCVTLKLQTHDVTAPYLDRQTSGTVLARLESLSVTVKKTSSFSNHSNYVVSSVMLECAKVLVPFFLGSWIHIDLCEGGAIIVFNEDRECRHEYPSGCSFLRSRDGC